VSRADTDAAKAGIRRVALARRAAAHAAPDADARTARATARLLELLRPERGRPLAGYMPMRGEISPLGAMAEMACHGPVGVPVVEGAGQPLSFRGWHPGARMIPGAFGALVPRAGAQLVPEVLIVPLLAFDAAGQRLGYGGGFYDRTLARLRAAGPVLAVGFAWAAQQQPGALPAGSTDQPLDVVVTEERVIRFR